jgi:hypothetical protein
LSDIAAASAASKLVTAYHTDYPYHIKSTVRRFNSKSHLLPDWPITISRWCAFRKAGTLASLKPLHFNDTNNTVNLPAAINNYFGKWAGR